ncbi:iron complex outermembrane receptor protein [Sphingobium wenxiniae]|uniref:Iron complex outermembrane receptor protein n=1 Tax=Sphingobium wenxiniae (strain DSM 21828 / CGMCC 1.7748 / JZ-1) TaxID=595605 RepID=A0A562K1Q3_SPHWJ|nr:MULTISPECIES: TonB-dependent receptor [Sphingomonadaceae]MBB6193769.1 iron complex outermembrane receptor protein [Sphingobium wenxiniae]TWH89371.1 iron complex outermembrane receptor protein [Sphingobium wenxiniae]
MPKTGLMVAAATSCFLIAAPSTAQQRDDAPARADTQVTIGGDEVVVTAKSMARSTANVLTSVDVLSGDVAQRQNVDNAWELFARVPGVVLTDFNQGTTSGRFSIRGFNGEGEINAVKLLIDGVPSNDNAGRMDFIDFISPLDIASVELVRGTSDPRWGLHAIAGSADIKTRIGGNYLDARGIVGAFGTYDAQMSAGVEAGRLSQNYLLSYRRSDGFRDHADLDRLNFAGKWFYDFGPAKLGLIARHSRSEADEPGYLTDADAYTDRQRSYDVSATDGGRRELGQYSLHLDADLARDLSLTAIGYATTNHDNRYVRFSANVPQQQRLTDEGHYGVMTGLHWHAADWLMAEAGGDVQWQHNRSLRWTTNRRIITAATRDQNFDLTVGGGYVQAIVTPVRWLTITPAWRIDRVGGSFTNRLNGLSYPVNDYGTISQPKLSVAVTPVPGLTAYGNFGRTFQIGAGSGAYVVPPRVRDVAASINEGFEGGIKLSQGHWLTARAAVWQQTATGELKRRLNDPSGEFDNLGATRRRGFDLEASVQPLPGLSAWASWSHQKAIIRVPDPAAPLTAGNEIDHVPRNVYTAGIEWAPTTLPWRASLWGNGQSSYELNTANSQGRYGEYFQLTAELAYRITKAIEISAQVRNLTNDRYEYVWYDGTQRLHAPADPRSVFGAVRARF